MTDELPEADDADEAEQRSAEALARALEGRAAADPPGPALEAAALLRLSTGSAELGSARRAQIREQVLASLPRRARRRTWLGVPPWLALSLPLASAAAVVFMLRSDRSTEPVSRRSAEPVNGSALAMPSDTSRATSPDEFSERAAAGPQLAPESSRRIVSGLADDARRSHEQLLARLHEPRLTDVHDEADAAAARGDLAGSERLLTSALDSLGSGWSNDDERLVRQDLFCRLAETALRLGQPRAALEWTRRGLDLDGPPTPFLAQLIALGGDAWVALGDEANAAKSYMGALRMHEAMLDENLRGRQ
jgi:hypothetical protein